MARYSPMRARPLTVREAATEWLASSRVGAWLFVHVFNRIDRHLLALSRGRVSVAVGAPVGMLHTIGARSGLLRRTPLLYTAEGDRLVLVASNGGASRHPAWFHNLRSHPEVQFLTREGVRRRYNARVADGAERDRLWRLAADFYDGYAIYQRRNPARAFPVVVLEPAARK